MDLGNLINIQLQENIGEIFNLGERINIINIALDHYTEYVNDKEEDVIIINPVGFTDDRKMMISEENYPPHYLIHRIDALCKEDLPVDGIVKLTTIIESMLSELLNLVFLKYPQKISDKNLILTSKVFEFESLYELQEYVFKKILNDLAYKSPEDFIKEFKNYTGVDLSLSEAYSHYMEVKACRDLIIHNKGIINEIYLRKTKTLARGQDGQTIICDHIYFLTAFEICIQLIEFLEKEFHNRWPSSSYSERMRNKTAS